MKTIKDVALLLSEFDAKCLMTIKEFRERVTDGYIIGYDGSGVYINDNGEKIGSVDFNVKDINKKIRQGIHFVCWYNK